MRKRRPRLEIVLFPLFVLGGTSCAAASGEPPFAERSVTVDGLPYAYQVFLPATWSPEERWPVILFLHGAGERGTDNIAQTRVGLPRLLREWPDFAAVVVIPQCPRSAWWGDPEIEKRVFTALEDAITSYRGDRQRVYLTPREAQAGSGRVTSCEQP